MTSDRALGVARALFARMVATRRPSESSSFGVSAAEVADVLAREDGRIIDPKSDLAVAQAVRALLDELATHPESRLAQLARTFTLDRIDLTIVSVLLAPELEHELERVLSFAIDDFTRKRPDVGFVARLVGGSDRDAQDVVLGRLSDDAPLRKHGLVTLGGDGPRLLRTIRLSDRIVGFLRNHDAMDESLRGFIRISGMPQRSGIVMNAEVFDRIERALRQPAARVLLAGAEGTGRAMVVEAVVAEQGRQALRVDLAGIVGDGRIAERVAAALREGALADAAIIFDGASSIGDSVPRALLDALVDGAAGLAVPVVFTFAGRPYWLANAFPELVELAVPAPGLRERHQLWQQALPSPLAKDEDLERVAARYAFTGGVIDRTARRAIASASLRDPGAPRVTLDDLGEAARLTFSNRLGGMAQRISTGFSWDDLVLPHDTYEAVREVVRFARHRPFLLEEWGFSTKLPYGRGVSAILAGPPGTGKTMVAQLLAKELGYDLYRIDLSQVVNKYIGETEKNLARIFDEAESAHAVLFFDEADSLFAKRTEVRSSNDRYANLEVNYLLQRMETYDGVTLLATNLEQGLDEAFKRRVRFSIAFELPEAAERQRLWKTMFPAQVPLAPDIDWAGVATKFEMAGGYIKKAALRAALMAAEGKRSVTMSDIVEAARQEYREMGRIV